MEKIDHLRCHLHGICIQCNLRQGVVNDFEAAIHRLYLCMNIPGPHGVIIVFKDQQVVRNKERDFVPRQ